jgi:glycine/D-amino acid oxidase-like deaminating enzyme
MPDFNTGRCLYFPRQAQFHPLRYLGALALAIVKNGGQIFCKTRATEIKGGKSAHVTTVNGFTVEASAVVVATNTPINDRVTIHSKQAGYLTYVIGAEVRLDPPTISSDQQNLIPLGRPSYGTGRRPCIHWA